MIKLPLFFWFYGTGNKEWFHSNKTFHSFHVIQLTCH